MWIGIPTITTISYYNHYNYYNLCDKAIRVPSIDYKLSLDDHK